MTLSQGSHEAICIADIYVMIYNSGYEVAKKTILWLGSHYSHIKGSRGSGSSRSTGLDSAVPTHFGDPVFATWPGEHGVVRSTLLSYQMGITSSTSQALESYTG